MMQVPAELSFLYNKIGFTDLEVAGRYKNDEWSRWVRFDVLMSRPNVNWNFFTDRTIADVEIVLDYDYFFCHTCKSKVESKKCLGCGREYTDTERKENIRFYVDYFIVPKLITDGLRFRDYFSGSKGRHIHLIYPELRTYSIYERIIYKRIIISRYGGERLKASNRVMILREGAINPKTGGKKMLINEVQGFNMINKSDVQ